MKKIKQIEVVDVNSNRYELKFSIILPVHNGGDYIKKCVSSILAQSYANFNLLILENASADGTFQWLKSIDDPRITIFPSDRFLSFEANWSRISQIKTNEFITIIGHDDVFDPDYLEVMSELIYIHPKATLYQTHFRFIDAAGKFIRHSRPMCQTQQVHEFVAAQLTFIMDSMGTGYMMRRKDFDLVGGFGEYPNLIFGDYELWVKLTALGYMVIAPSENFSYREHDSASASTQVSEYKNSLLKYWKFLEKMAEQNKYLCEVINRYGATYLKSMCEGFIYRSLRTTGIRRNNTHDIIDDFEFIISKINYNSNYTINDGCRFEIAMLTNKWFLTRLVYKTFLKAKKCFRSAVKIKNWIRNEGLSLF